MTRHPASDTRSVPAAASKPREYERYFASDLAVFLRVSTEEVCIYARRKQIARWVRLMMKNRRETEVVWVTRSAARQIIEHFRAKQGAVYQKGRDWVEERAKRVAAGRRRTERERAAREQARALGRLAKLIGGPVSGAQLPEAGPDGVTREG